MMLLIFSGGPRKVLCVSANLFITGQLPITSDLPEEETGNEEIDTDEKSTERPSSSSNRKPRNVKNKRIKYTDSLKFDLNLDSIVMELMWVPELLAMLFDSKTGILL
jgi:hypothetical protein